MIENQRVFLAFKWKEFRSKRMNDIQHHPLSTFYKLSEDYVLKYTSGIPLDVLFFLYITLGGKEL